MQISDHKNPWRDLLRQQASFRGKMFHVERGSRNSGRRGVPHEYPKRNDPYGEDMGRRIRRWSFTGYLIYRPSSPLYEYVSHRNALKDALEADDAGLLIHPVFAPGSGILAICEQFSMSESRERGGYTEFEMTFFEAGTPGNSVTQTNTQSAVTNNSSNLEQQAATNLNNTVDPSIPAPVPLPVPDPRGYGQEGLWGEGGGATGSW